MKLTDIIRRSGRSLKQAKVRTLLTAIAISVGGFTIAVSLAVGEGARNYVNTIINSNVNPQSLIVAADKQFFGPEDSGLREYDPQLSQVSGGFGGTTFIKTISEEQIETIGNTEGVASVKPVRDLTIKYLQGANDQKYVGTVAEYDETILIDQIAAGAVPKLGVSIAADEIVVPESFVEDLGFESAQQAIGKAITLTAEKPQSFTQEEVLAFIQSGKAFTEHDAPEAEQKVWTLKIVAVASPSPTQQAANEALQVSSTVGEEAYNFVNEGTEKEASYQLAQVIAKDGYDPQQVRSNLEAAGFEARTAKDLQELIFTFVNILQAIVLGFGIIALIASVFGIINTMYISVLERTQQIGLMKALGMPNANVNQIFLLEAGWIGFIGGTLGMLVAYIGGVIANPIITEQLNLGDGNYLLIFKPLQMVGLIIALILVAIISGLLPARKASKLDPIEALRTE